jgi:membrane protein
MATAAKPLRLTRARDLRRLARGIAHAFVEHHLLTYSSAVAFQALVALVPLTLLGLALLGALGLHDVWRDSIAPALHGRVTEPVFRGLDHSGRRIVQNGDAGLIAIASLLSLWYLTAAMRAVMEALSLVHDVRDRRPGWRRLGIAAGLGAVTGATLVGSVLLVAAAPRAGTAPGVLLGIGRWVLAVLLIAFVVGLLVRYAPAEHPNPRWTSAGVALVVGCWLVASALFRLWVEYVANFRTPAGTLLGLLVLTGYLYVSAAVFLVGVQLDELLRKKT